MRDKKKAAGQGSGPKIVEEKTAQTQAMAMRACTNAKSGHASYLGNPPPQTRW